MEVSQRQGLDQVAGLLESVLILTGKSRHDINTETAIRHQRLYGDAPYDDFLDTWHAERFDATELMALIDRCHLKYPFYGSRRIRDWLADGAGHE